MTKGGAVLLSPGSLSITGQGDAKTPAKSEHGNSSSQDGAIKMATSNEENRGNGEDGDLASTVVFSANTAGAVAGTKSGASSSSNNNSAAFATPKKATASRATDSRLPTVPKSTSVFDRLYKSHTISSKSHSLSGRAMMSPKARSKLRTKVSPNVEKDLQLFSRMTLADSRSKRRSTPHKIKHSALGKTAFSTPPPKQSTYELMVPHSAPPMSSGSSVLSTSSTLPSARSRTTRYEFSPRMKPVTKLYFISKFHPGVGLEPVEPISLGYTFFQAFCEYESGNMDAPTIAKEILVAFFKKDFPAGRHWELHEPTVGEKVAGRTASAGTYYPVSMSATYDWDDAYRVAHAKGVVRFRRVQKEIRIENYRYDLTGDP